jgi:hypothetical protein
MNSKMWNYWSQGECVHSFKETTDSQVLVTHAHNPSYLGGRDQEDCGSKPAWANSARNPILKIPNTKMVGELAQGVGSEFKSQYWEKKKKP